MWAVGRLGAALLAIAVSIPHPTGNKQLQCPYLASPHGTSAIPAGKAPQGISWLHSHWGIGCQIVKLSLEVSGFHPFGSSGCKKCGFPLLFLPPSLPGW